LDSTQLRASGLSQDIDRIEALSISLQQTLLLDEHIPPKKKLCRPTLVRLDRRRRRLLEFHPPNKEHIGFHKRQDIFVRFHVQIGYQINLSGLFSDFILLLMAWGAVILVDESQPIQQILWDIGIHRFLRLDEVVSSRKPEGTEWKAQTLLSSS
jgi:hypothetical protein